MKPKLSVLIATCRPAGIERVVAMNLPEVDGVHYWVSWQMHENLPVPEPLASRKDVTVLRADTIGLSKNRNNLLESATGDVFLIADDDLRYTSTQLVDVIRAFDENPDVDYASFMFTGADVKVYPSHACSLWPVPKNFSQTSFEVAIRNNSRTSRLRYNPFFGLGAPVLRSGEDELFLISAIQQGLDCRFFPIIITHHEGLTTGTRKITDNGVLKASGAVIAVQYPLTSILRIPLKAYRLHKSGQASFGRSLINMLRGMAYLMMHREVREKIYF